MNRQSGQRILRAYYSDNYVSLLPGESETVTIRYSADEGEALVKNTRLQFRPHGIPLEARNALPRR
jgi:hypothetical protein